MTVVPILLYHGVSSNPSDEMASFTVTPETFARHMDLIIDGGFRCLTVSELVDEMEGPDTDLGKVALVTFDDGYADFTENALPVLADRHLASTMYITTGYVEHKPSSEVRPPSDPILSWADIRDLPGAPVRVEVGAHSHSHPQMDTLSSGKVREELIRSKVLLEDALDVPVRSFAYPHGYNSPRVRRQTRDAGYDSAVAVRNLLSHSDDDPFQLARLMVRSHTGIDTVRHWLAGEELTLASRRESLKTLGWRTYRNLRRARSRLQPVR